MLDENLPTFLLKSSTEKPKQLSTYYYSQYGSEPEPAYSLRHPDPSHHDSRNRYAAALYDSYNSDVLYGEVLLIPAFNTPNPTAEQLRQNGGIPPPPEPILPTEFTIQLYNPDQQVLVRQKPGTFTSAPSWEFEMPQQTFREPSVSTLDRTQDDPAALENTPKVGLKWKKDSKFAKDLVCFLSGKSLNPDGSKRKNKEPDITVAIFKGLKEITLYEPNWQRVDIEDMKGFEVVLLLGAVVIRDVYFGNMKDTFNISDGRRLSQTSSPAGLGLTNIPGRFDSPKPHHGYGKNDSRIPPTDPRSQWEIDAEATLLKRQAAQEERERKKREEAEQKQIKKMLEAEEREQKRKQAEIDRETERLKRLWGQEDASARPSLPPRHSAPPTQWTNNQSGYMPQQPYQYNANPSPYGTFANSPWLSSTPPPPPSVHFNPAPQQPTLHHLKPKTSFFGFRRGSDQDDSRLQKKRSALF